MSTLHTNQQPARMAINRKDVAELVDVIANEVIRRIDAREQHRMISNAVQQGVTRHLEQQRTAAAKPTEVDIFADYRINDDSAATYMNNLLEQK